MVGDSLQEILLDLGFILFGTTRDHLQRIGVSYKIRTCNTQTHSFFIYSEEATYIKNKNNQLSWYYSLWDNYQ